MFIKQFYKFFIFNSNYLTANPPTPDIFIFSPISPLRKQIIKYLFIIKIFQPFFSGYTICKDL